MISRRLVLAIVGGLALQGAAYADPSTPVQASDADITDRVVHKLVKMDPDVAPRIRVSTEGGVVTLDGTVFTGTQLVKVLGDARAVSGVVKVENRLHVQM